MSTAFSKMPTPLMTPRKASPPPVDGGPEPEPEAWCEPEPDAAPRPKATAAGAAALNLPIRRQRGASEVVWGNSSHAAWHAQCDQQPDVLGPIEDGEHDVREHVVTLGLLRPEETEGARHESREAGEPERATQQHARAHELNQRAGQRAVETRS